MTSYPPSPPSAAPPTSPQSLEPEPQVWPRVVGIISIVWGALHMCGLLCAAAGPLITPNNPMASSQMTQALSFSPAWNALSMIVGTGNSVLLIVAGAVLLSRRPLGRTLHLVWASIAATLWFIGIVMMAVMMPTFNAWAQSNPQDPAAQMLAKPGMGLFMVAMLVVSSIVSLVWPVFCLVWFGLLGKGRTPRAASNDARPMAYPDDRR